MTNEWQIRIYMHEQGGFMHCRVFAGDRWHGSNCGTLTFYKEEMEKVKATMPGVLWISKDNEQKEIGN